MNLQKLLEYFEQAKGYKHIKDVICVLCGAGLEIRSIEGTIFNCCDTKILSPSLPPITTPKHNYNCPHQTETCLRINSEVLERAFSSREPQISACARGIKRILLPIILKKELVGFLLISENKNYQLSQMQVRAIINLLLDLVAEIDAKELRTFEGFAGNDATYQQNVVKKAAAYIRENYYSPELSLKQVSKENGISYHYLSRLFKKELNTSFSQFVSRVRMDVASRLLKDKSLSVGEIAFSCGFDDPGYFCKVFKRTFGTTPVTFREKKRPLVIKSYKKRFLPA